MSQALQLVMGRDWTGVQGPVCLNVCLSELPSSPSAQGLPLLVHSSCASLFCIKQKWLYGQSPFYR